MVAMHDDDDETDGNWQGRINSCDPLCRNKLYAADFGRMSSVLRPEHRATRCAVANALGSSRQWPRDVADMFNTCYTLKYSARFQLVVFLWGNGVGADCIKLLLKPLVKSSSFGHVGALLKDLASGKDDHKQYYANVRHKLILYLNGEVCQHRTYLFGKLGAALHDDAFLEYETARFVDSRNWPSSAAVHTFRAAHKRKHIEI